MKKKIEKIQTSWTSENNSIFMKFDTPPKTDFNFFFLIKQEIAVVYHLKEPIAEEGWSHHRFRGNYPTCKFPNKQQFIPEML